MTNRPVEPESAIRRVKAALLLFVVALLATCGLWLTSIEGGERFIALHVGGVAIAGDRRFAVLAITAVIALIAGAILFVLALFAYASRFE